MADDSDSSSSSSSSSSDEDDWDYPLQPPGLFPPLSSWTPINAHKSLYHLPLDSTHWGNGINPRPLKSIDEDESEPECAPRILPMVKHSLRRLAVKERKKQPLPAIFRHRVYARSPLARETVVAKNHMTGKMVTRHGEHLGCGIIGDWSPYDGFSKDWREKVS
jgi:hypothetical protein